MTDSNQASAAARSAQLALRICTRPCGVTHDEKTDNAAEEEAQRSGKAAEEAREDGSAQAYRDEERQ